MDLNFLHLLYISAIQFAFLLVLYVVTKGARLNFKVLSTLLFLGIPIGLIFDLIFGLYGGIFEYPGVEFMFPFLILNGALSYGCAIATAWLLPCGSLHIKSIIQRRWTIIAVLIVAGAFAVTYFLEFPPLIRAFVAGSFVIVTGEILAMTFGCCGPVWAAYRGDGNSFKCLVAWSFVIGGLYEIANFLFPLWRWSLGPLIPNWTAEVLIVTLGYFVLVHPMFLLSRIVLGEPR